MQKTPSNVENKITWRKIICKNILYGTKQEVETIQDYTIPSDNWEQQPFYFCDKWNYRT